MAYRINASLVGATVIGGVCIIMEAVAISHDMQFNENLRQNLIFQPDSNCSFFPSHDGSPMVEPHGNDTNASRYSAQFVNRDKLERNLPMEPISITIMIVCISVCCISLVITCLYWKSKTAKMVICMNKIVSSTVAVCFAAAGILLSLSINLYDQHYIEYNGNHFTVCNMGQHFINKQGTDCDNEYKICQRKILKVSVAVMMFICSIFATSAVYQEFHVSATIDDAKNAKQIDDMHLVNASPTLPVVAGIGDVQVFPEKSNSGQETGVNKKSTDKTNKSDHTQPLLGDSNKKLEANKRTEK